MLQIVLSEFRPLLGSDPRDEAFGLLGLALESKELGIQPDYASAWQDVFTNTTRVILGVEFSWFPFKDDEPDSSRTEPSLPSWVPNWGSQPSRVLAIKKRTAPQVSARLEHPQTQMCGLATSWTMPSSSG